MRGAVVASGGLAVPASNLHLTLAFLGSVPERRLVALTDIAGRVAAAVRGSVGLPLRFSFTRIEYWKKAQLLCAVADAEIALAAALATELKSELVRGGFTPDLRPFLAHVTLARKVRIPSPDLAIDPVPWSFTGFALAQSQTTPAGAIYSVVDSWLLDMEPPAAHLR